MARPRDEWRRTYYFKVGDVFPADDRMARYVMRLSLALGDMRIAADYAVRNRQRNHERLYFVRLLASHMRELVLLLDPPNRKIVPEMEEFLASLPRGNKPPRKDIRAAHQKAMRRLAKVMPGRPNIVASGVSRPPTLRDDLKELRNRFFHYGHDASGDTALRRAMTVAEDSRSSYIIRERTMRARYADLVAVFLAHPFDDKFASDMHKRIIDLIGPVATYVQMVEAAWLFSRPEGMVTYREPGDRTYRPFSELKYTG
jgi:hypothetical protein